MKMFLHLNDERKQIIEIPYESTGFQFEIMEITNCLRAGVKESTIMPLDETLEIMKTMDTMRAQWGLKYPGES